MVKKKMSSLKRKHDDEEDDLDEDQDVWWLDQSEECNIIDPKNDQNLLIPFTKFLEDKQFSDVVLIDKRTTKEYKAHKIILARGSDFFRKNLNNKNSLEIDDSKEILPDLLNFIYSENLPEISPSKGPALFQSSTLFGIPMLREAVLDQIRKTLSPFNVIEFISESLKANCVDIKNLCLLYLAKKFNSLNRDVYLSALEPQIFLQLLQHQQLTVESEFVVYETVYKYLVAKKVSDEVRVEMMNLVKFPLMNITELEIVNINPLVPENLKKEAFLLRLKIIEGDPTEDEFLKYPRLQPRCSKEDIATTFTGSTKKFKYVSDFDNNGIVYYLGTENGKLASFVNPHNSGLIILNAECGTQSSYSIAECLSHIYSSVYYNSAQLNGWVSFDFGAKFPKIKIIPTHYTIRSGGMWCLINWNFEGSTDGSTYDILDEHVNDNILLTSTNVAHTFSLNVDKKSKLPASKKTKKIGAYRYFRIKSTGIDSSGTNYITLAGFELYGTVQFGKKQN